MEKWCIGEKIQNFYKVFIVALPDNQHDEFIRVSMRPLACIAGTLYYSDNTAETLDDWQTLRAALTPEWAKIHIPGYREGMKLTVVNAFCNYYYPFDEEKANNKLHDKLEQLTQWEFYNSKW